MHLNHDTAIKNFFVPGTMLIGPFRWILILSMVDGIMTFASEYSEGSGFEIMKVKPDVEAMLGRYSGWMHAFIAPDDAQCIVFLENVKSWYAGLRTGPRNVHDR